MGNGKLETAANDARREVKAAGPHLVNLIGALDAFAADAVASRVENTHAKHTALHAAMISYRLGDILAEIDGLSLDLGAIARTTAIVRELNFGGLADA